MKCQEFESVLNEVLDQRKDPREVNVLQQHADSCESCSATFEIYIAIGEYSQTVVPTSLEDKKRYSSYVLAATAAAVLLLLLSPIGDLITGDRNDPGLAQLRPQTNNEVVVSSNDPVGPQQGTALNAAALNADSLNPEFWRNGKFTKMVPLEQLALQVPKAPNLQDVGQSINSVWLSIKEDDFILPIIKQSALLWMP